MNRLPLSLAAVSLAALLSHSPLHAQEGPVATVNGVEIPGRYADFMAGRQEGRSAAQNPTEMRKAIRENLINREVVVQEAKRSEMLDKPEVKTELELVRQAAIVRIYMREWLKSNAVTDEEVRTAYDDARGKAGGREYHAHHILLDSEDAALQIIEALNGGASFESLAKQSKDPGSRARGGDLGWALPTIYVKPFADALTALEKGQTTAAPVKTRFGYHVIRLDDVREVKVPPFDQVQQRIRQQLTQRKVSARVGALRDKAEIQ